MNNSVAYMAIIQNCPIKEFCTKVISPTELSIQLKTICN